MLRVGPWNRLPLTIRWLKEEYKMDFDPLKQPPIHMPIVYGPIPSWKKPKIKEKGNTTEDELIPVCKICESFITVSLQIMDSKLNGLSLPDRTCFIRAVS